MILGGIIFFVFGSIIGSFLNVVILRYNTGRDVIRGRSSCPVCRHELGFLELVPIISFIFLRARCRKCLSKISWQYPLVELFTGVIFAAVFLKMNNIPNSLFLIPYSLVIFSVLITIFVYDWKHKIIPDGLVYGFITLSFLNTLFLIPHSSFFILDLLAGPIMFLPFFLLWFFSSGRWMGLGDAKLATGIGWFLGFSGAVSAVILGFWIGAVVGVLMLLIKSPKRLTIKSEIPFAPFLIIGLWLVYFFGFDIVGLHLLLSH